MINTRFKETGNDTLANKKASMTFHAERKEITGNDFTDQNNYPACFSKSKRGIKKAWETLKEQWTENTTMYQAITILNENKIRMHSYCEMD